MFRIGFPGDSVVKNFPAKQKMPFQSLGQEDALQKEMATHFALFRNAIYSLERNLFFHNL